MTGSTVLNLRGVRKTYGGREVLAGLDFSLSAGECVALLGPNGAGKSTTIALALGLAQADSGLVELLGKALPEAGHIARKDVGVVPQYDALDPDFTVFENLMVFGRYFGLHGDSLRERAESLLNFAQLVNRKNDSVTTLSGGMRRRLMLARALINQPRVLFLDEPTTGLDPQAKHVIWDRLVDLKRQGMAMFLTTHYMDEAQRLADRVAVLDHGNIVACDKPLTLIRNVVGHSVLEVWGTGAERCVAQLVGQKGISKLEPLVAPIEQRGETFYFRNEKADEMLEALKRSPQSDVDYIYRPGNLEDVFFSLTGRALRDD
ncbi:MAG: ATP-binding cassette domain-containing protein [Burkholderiales bacterium]|uniref:ATP-binding cassette domain-containing protein n=1 Tax=Limnobacter sp. TaxID=2003368 RepID=UPI003953F07A|nr:ATP-binding cassette domain-containing protein [Burkholderiales bacterium]